MKQHHRIFLAGVALFLGHAAASADQLADIKSRGTLTCGVLGAFEPFGYSDLAKRELVGYDVDLCHALAKGLGVKAEVRAVSIEARIPELQQKRMDVLAAGLGYSAQRAEQVDFSSGYYVSDHKLTTKTDRGFTANKDLSGKRISFTKGGITEGFVKASVPGAVLVGYEDTPTAFTALAQGKVDAFSVSEVVARRLVNKLGPTGSQFKVLDAAVGSEIWGLGVRKGEPALLKALNDVLASIETSGEAQRIFDKWLGASSIYQMKRAFKIEPIKN